MSEKKCKEEDCWQEAMAVAPAPVKAKLRAFRMPETRKAMLAHPNGLDMAIKFEESVISVSASQAAEGEALLAELRAS